MNDIKRRGFLKGLLGAGAVVPILPAENTLPISAPKPHLPVPGVWRKELVGSYTDGFNNRFAYELTGPDGGKSLFYSPGIAEDKLLSRNLDLANRWMASHKFNTEVKQ